MHTTHSASLGRRRKSVHGDLFVRPMDKGQSSKKGQIENSVK